MTPVNTTMLGSVLVALAAGLALPASAQDKGGAGKKLYCWTQNGQRTCADSLPPEAMAAAREEISVSSGMRTGEVQRALTDEERAQAAAAEAQRRSQALADETRRRTEQALLTSFQNEDELRRVFLEKVHAFAETLDERDRRIVDERILAEEPKTLQEMGLDNVAHLDGGFTAWHEAGQPVETV